MPPARFTLEEHREAQAPERFEVLRDPSLYEFLEDDPPASVQALAEKLARSEHRLSPNPTQHWLNRVVRVESGAIVGYVQATVEENKETNGALICVHLPAGLSLTVESGGEPGGGRRRTATIDRGVGYAV